MIKPVDQMSMNFKALYKAPNTNFSDTQKKVLKDIENEVSSLSLYKYDFFVIPKDSTQVELFAISSPTYNLQTKMPESKYKKSIGLYSEAHPFNKNKIDKKTKAGVFWANWGNIITSATALICLLSAIMAFSSKGNKQPIKEITEKVVTIKDTLNNIGKDTLDLTKRLVK